ncbi:MAG: hypothetical protein ACMUHM_05580 [Thermoplasmatota archaeon]
MKVLSVFIILAMVLSIQPEMGEYTHEYQSDTQNGVVSNETGPVIINLLLEPHSICIFEFNCSDGDEIEVQIWDSDNDPMFIEPFTGEAVYLVINDTTKEDILGASYDDLYYPSLPGISAIFDTPFNENITIEIRGAGNYTLILHWRELEEWEKGTSSSSTTIVFLPSFFVLICGILFLFIGSVVVIVIVIITILRKRV